MVKTRHLMRIGIVFLLVFLVFPFSAVAQEDEHDEEERAGEERGEEREEEGDDEDDNDFERGDEAVRRKPPDGSSAAENEYYKMLTLSVPDVSLEVGGLALLPDGRMMAATRRGEVFIVENAYSDPPLPLFKQFTFGLGEVLGLLPLDGSVYASQRGELTRMEDVDGDDRADVFETVGDAWELSGDYHEYTFGPRQTPDGKLWVTLNVPFGAQPLGSARWRGWAARVDPETRAVEFAAGGLRSPAGLEVSPWGELFYTDNQGEWCNNSKLSLIEVGDFHGHPYGMTSASLPGSLVDPLPEGLPKRSGTYMYDLKKDIPNFKMPSIWFPYIKMGNSPSGLKWDTSAGKFGPFSGQLFVGDQRGSNIMRVFLEKIGGHWQGALFNFRRGFQSGIIRLAFGEDSSLFVGMSNRGWGSRGSSSQGLQRLVWTGKVPFEVHEMRAQSDGFEYTFTQPLDRGTAENVASYTGESYTYRLTPQYGGPEADKLKVEITSTTVAEDGLSVRVVVEPLRAGYVHEIHLDGVRSGAGTALLHKESYYTLINIPGVE